MICKHLALLSFVALLGIVCIGCGANRTYEEDAKKKLRRFDLVVRDFIADKGRAPTSRWEIDAEGYDLTFLDPRADVSGDQVSSKDFMIESVTMLPDGKVRTTLVALAPGRYANPPTPSTKRFPYVYGEFDEYGEVTFFTAESPKAGTPWSGSGVTVNSE